MWTPATRRRHNRENLRYETDLTDREWNLIAPMMPVTSRTGRPRKWPLREIMNAIFYFMRAEWRSLDERIDALNDDLTEHARADEARPSETARRSVVRATCQPGSASCRSR